MGLRLRFAAMLPLVVAASWSFCFLPPSLGGQDAVPPSSANDPNPLFAVKKDGKWGYIDKAGKVVIPFRYTLAGNFSEGLAPVATSERKILGARWDRFGFVDKTGREVVPLEYMGAREFSEGLAQVFHECRHRYIDKSGEMLRLCQSGESFGCDFTREFSDGLAVIAIRVPVRNVFIMQKAEYGYVSAAGQMVIPFQYSDATSFSEGLAGVKVGRDWGFIDKSGATIVAPQFKEVKRFVEGLAAVKTGDKWGFIDRKGHMVIPARYQAVGSFTQGLGAVRVGGKYGFIDGTGAMVIQPQFDQASAFSEEFAAVRVGSKSGYIDKTGKMAIVPQFSDAQRFFQGLAAVKVRNKWGFIEKTGQMVIAPQFDMVSVPLEEGPAAFLINCR